MVQFACVAVKKEILKKISRYLFLIAFILNGTYIISRGVVASRLPLANQFEFATAFAWGIALIYMAVCFRYEAEWLSIVMMPAAFLVLSYAALLPKEISELMPALKSVWFGLHVTSAVFSYAAFVTSGCIGIVYLLKTKKEGNLMQMDYLSYRIICFGFMLLTVVILSGCLWAEQAWSSFWSWDPKETWALITWIVYAIYLHQRLVKDWQGKKMAIFSIVAIVFVLFTFIGVNTFMSGLHSYN